MTGTARCTEPGCPVRYSVGADRPCRDHRGDGADLAERMTQMGIDPAAAPAGQHGDGAEDKQAQDSSTLADHEPPNDHEHLRHREPSGAEPPQPPDHPSRQPRRVTTARS